MKKINNSRINICIFLYTLFIVTSLKSQSPNANHNHWIVDNRVSVMLQDTNYLYVGGNFTYVGPPTGCGVMITDTNSNPDLTYCRPIGVIFSVVSDGVGGWFIGGNFTSVITSSNTSVVRNRIAHVYSNGQLDMTWNPSANADVRSFVLSGGDLYVGGDFTNIGGQSRNRIAKLSATGSGLADAIWNPNASNTVMALALSGNDLYAAGSFTVIGGQTRNRIAKLSTLGVGAVDGTWNPNSSNTVRTLLLSGSDLYVGGDFTNIGGASRNRIAKLTTTNNGYADTVWNPNANAEVRSIALLGSDLFVGGSFTGIGGQIRNRVAKLSANGTGAADIIWNPNSNLSVHALSLSGSDLFVGGDFSNIGGLTRNYFAKLSTSGTGIVSSNISAGASSSIYALSSFGSNLYIGGGFISFGGLKRNNIARFSKIDGTADVNWNPNVNGNIDAIAISGSNVYVGGSFTIIGGQNRNNIAKVSAIGTGMTDTIWNPNANSSISDIVVLGNDVYVGGTFTTINWQNRNRIAKINASGIGTLDPIWNPYANGNVMKLLLSGSYLFVSGQFSIVGGQARNSIAKLNISGTGAADVNWNANANVNATIRTMALSGNDLYIGGAFVNIGGQVRNNIAKLNATGTGILDSIWNPNANSWVNTITVSGSDVYVGGDFSNIGGLTRNYIAKLNAWGAGASDPTWNPIPNSLVWDLVLSGSNLYVGGWYTSIGGISPRNGLASIGILCGLPTIPTVSASNNPMCSGNNTNLSIVNGALNSANNWEWYNTSCGAGAIGSGTNIIISPSLTTTYYVRGEGGCVDTPVMCANITITVNPTPTISVNSGSICSGESFTIVPGGAITYSYSSGSYTVAPTTNSSYTVTGINLDGCVGNTISSVTVNALPSLTVSSVGSICEGSSISIIASGANTYTWNTGATTSSISVMPTTTGTYTVTGTDLNNCSNTQTVSVTVDLTCQDVWPGDANSDGTADNLDVLELGLHYTQTGTPRASTSNSWQSYFANNWIGTITNGKNLNHSDCNGDGTINDDDTLAIYNNYGLAHAFKPAQTITVNPQLSIMSDQTSLVKGSWGTASIYLGDAATNINNINGVAFTVDFDNTLIETNSIYIEYQNSFLDAGQNLHFRKLDFSNGKIFTATTHTINNNVSGNGLVGILHYKILSSLTTDEVLNLNLVQGYKSEVSGQITPLTVGTGTLMAMGSSVGLQELNGNIVSISPNPTNGSLTINSKTELQKIEVVAITGQVLVSEVPTNVSHTLHLDNFSNGIYFVNFYQNDRIVKREKVVLNK